MSDQRLFDPPKKKERLGFYGFALGLVIYIVGLVILNVIPYGYVVIAIFYTPFTNPLQALMSFVYPVIWAIPFIFIPRTKTVV